MIVPMKKVSLVLLEDHRKDALKKLRRLGVVHLEKVNGASQELTEFRDAYSKAELAYSILSEIKLPKKAAPTASFDRDKVLAKAQEVVALAERKKQCTDIITAHTLELERFAGWGDLDVESFQFLASKGIILSLYEIPRAAYLSMPETVETMVVNEAKSFVRVLLIQHGEKGSTLAAACRPAEMPAEAYAVPMISSSSQALRDEIAALKEEIVSIDKALASAALDRNLLKQYCSVVGKDIEFENLFSGMGREDETEEGRPYMALAWLTGFVPVEDVAGVLVAAKEESWAVAVSDPTEEDEVPTKLKNNKFVSLIYPVSDFLGTVPGYTEYDISGWFLLFFCVFFGIIFGDGGYGALMVVAAVLADIMAVAKKKKIPPAYNLLLLLGFFTMAWGTVTCTWFGLSTDMLPGWLTSLCSPYRMPMRPSRLRTRPW